MISFQCEACGDALKKPDVDAHKYQCPSASYSCQDCMKHFRGTEYKSHTSCISEARKYQGPLYQGERKSSNGTNDVSARINRSRRASIATDLPSLKASVEDLADHDNHNSVAIVDAPPPAPSPPPPRKSLAAINVFDFLVTDETPNASRTSLAPAEPMRMKSDAPTLFETSRQLQEMQQNGMSSVNNSVTALVRTHDTDHDSVYEKYGYSYGDGPVLVLNDISEPQQAITPAPKRSIDQDRDLRLAKHKDKADHSKDKKRKRHPVEDLDLTASRPRALEDEIMIDAPPVLHSGLTGGLNRLLSRPELPPSPDFSGGDNPSPGSPLKRSKRSSTAQGKDRLSSLQSNGKTDTRKSSSSSNPDGESRPRKKHHRRHRHRSHRGSTISSERPTKMKAIEYHPPSTIEETDNGASGATPTNQLVLYQTRTELFMSFVNKGPDSEKGCSMNKVLKRYHRERGGMGLGLGKGEEEKELWKSIRLKKNERGEIVLFVGS